jgi:branched-chain amino acid transport system substrate-binding protein
VLTATIAAATVALMTGEGATEPPVGSGVAAIGLNGERVGSFIDAQMAPSNIAVGEGAVWVLNTEDKTISRIDPKTKRIVKTFQSPHRPIDLAAGAGALWVGNADERTNRAKVSISRIDPDTGRVTNTVQVPHKPDRGGWESVGHPMIAVGAGAVWTGNRQGSISRLDPKTGEVVATVDTFARRIAAGREGVWVVGIDGNDLWGIDPRTNKATQHVRLGAYSLYAITVGAGSVWAVSSEGSLWRVDPRPPNVTSTIDVGVGTEYVAFGDGQVWTGNFVDGTVSRIDPRRNAVVAKVPVGASQSLAVGAGSAWVSVARGTRDGVLPDSTCGEVSAGGRKPDVLIVSDLPLQGPSGGDVRAMADAIRFVLKDHGYRAGKFTVGYQSCDDSTAQSGNTERRKCAANANAYVGAANVVALIGPLHSVCAQVEIPILNRAPGGPVAIVSPSNGVPSLTRGGRLASPPPTGLRGEPEVYYPTGRRNYARVISRDDQQGVALAMLARRLGLRRVYLLYDEPAGDASLTSPFRRVAGRLGVGIAGTRDYERIADFGALAGVVARSGADGVVIGGWLDDNGEPLRSLRARLGKRAAIMAGESFAEDIPFDVKVGGRAARGVYVATTQLPADGVDLTPAATRFTREFGTAAYGWAALQTAQAAEVVLQAIERSDGTRASVLRELHATRIKDGLLGSFGFDRYGDMTPGKVAILRITGATPPNLQLPAEYQGAVIDQMMTVPAELSG